MVQTLEADNLTVTMQTRDTDAVAEDEMLLVTSHFDAILAGMYRHLAEEGEDR